MYGASQGYSGGACGAYSSCGKCAGGESDYSNLEGIAESESRVYEGNRGGTVFSYEISGFGYGAGGLGGGSYGGRGNFNYEGNLSSNSYGMGSLTFGGDLNYKREDLGFLNYKNNKTEEWLNNFLKTRINEEYRFVPDDFLRPERRRQRFIGKAEEIQGLVEEAFEEVMGREFPDDIRVQVLNGKEFRKLTANPGVVGLSVNRKEEGLLSDIFVLEDELDRVMLTVGHEIGHVLSKPLKDKRDEEAKAFAFSLGWMEAIREKDIGGLRGSVAGDNPAKNGVHDVALGFVVRLKESGKKALEIFRELVRGRVAVEGAEGE